MRRFAWLVAVLAATLAAPASALADKSYTISQAAVNVTVARTGEVLMREDLDVQLRRLLHGRLP